MILDPPGWWEDVFGWLLPGTTLHDGTGAEAQRRSDKRRFASYPGIHGNALVPAMAFHYACAKCHLPRHPGAFPQLGRASAGPGPGRFPPRAPVHRPPHALARTWLPAEMLEIAESARPGVGSACFTDPAQISQFCAYGRGRFGSWWVFPRELRDCGLAIPPSASLPRGMRPAELGYVQERIPATAPEVTVAMDAKGEQTAFVYTTYIQETPGRVWQGLTDPALMKRYWRHQTAGPKTFHSDWKKGSTYEMAHDEVGLAVRGPGQVILEADPPRRLAYTWHTITPEWAAAVGMDEATAAAWRAEARSKVAFDIDDVGHGVVKLTVTHDGFAPGSAVLPAISEGWPAVLASLKTLLETGSSLRTS